MKLRHLTVVTKNHFDCGFTASEGKVLHDACRWLLPTAAEQFRKMREAGEPMSWCVPSFVAWHALETLDGEALRTVEAGFAAGDLSWHALPFTTHTELLDESLVCALTDISRRLDMRFGRRTTCAKLTDVPGHTLALVQSLSRAGIECLHIGVNWMSPVPQIPELSLWRDGRGNEVLLKINPNYGGEIQLPGEDTALFWNVVGDNMEVPGEADLLAALQALRTKYPEAEVRGGTAENWAQGNVLERARAAELPIVDCDLGDSWIFGTGTDPWKTQRLREAMRLRREWLKNKKILPDSKIHFDLNLQMHLVAEHTWGGAVAGWTHHNRTHWNNSDFSKIRHKGHWAALEASWIEQRDHITDIAEVLEDLPDLQMEMLDAWESCRPVINDFSTWKSISLDEPHQVASSTLRFAADGSINSFINGETERVAGALGLLRYQTFDAADCQRAVAEYCRVEGKFLIEEFAKMGLDGSEALSRMIAPTATAAYRKGNEFCIEMAFDNDAVERAGAPDIVTAIYEIFPKRIECRIEWLHKFPTRLPEALWWTFQPRVADPSAWRFDKSGYWLDPAKVPAKGGRCLHAIQSGAKNGSVFIETRDAHLAAPYGPMLYRFPDTPELPMDGLHLNLSNNLWGTNFPQWCGDALAFRSTVHF